MKSTGIVRKVDELGRIVIPKSICTILEVKGGSKGTGTPMEIFVDGQDIIIRKYSPGCYCCSEITADQKEIFGRYICTKCYEDFKSQMNLIDDYMEFKNDRAR